MTGVGTVLLLVDFGLHLIEEDSTLTFMFFLGASLLFALGLRFSYYAQQNMRQTQINSQRMIWGYLRFIGVLGAAYSAVWLLEISSSLGFGPKNGIWLAMTLSLVLSLRQISVTAGGVLDERFRSVDQFLRLGFIGVIVLYVLAALLFGDSTIAPVIEGAGGIAFLVYGFYFFRRQISSTRLQGTMLDSLVRHLIPVLAFGAFVSIVALAIPFGTDRTIILHVQLVFLIMTATALMTATIKLRQNLASL